MGVFARLMLLTLACSVIDTHNAWRILHPQSSSARGSKHQPSIRYGLGSARLGDSWILTHGYFFDQANTAPNWMSDTWAMDVHAPYNFKLLRDGIPRHQARDAYKAGRRPHAPYGRFGAAVAAAGDSIYLIGGQDGGHSQHEKDGYEPGYEYDELWRFDLATNAWTHLEPTGKTPGARFLHSMAAIGHHIYIFGGNLPGQGDVWAYNTKANTWEQLAPELSREEGGPGRRAGARMLPLVSKAGRTGLVVLAGRVFLSSSGFDLTDDAWFFDLHSRQWQALQATSTGPTPRMYHGADWVQLQHADHSATVGIIMGGTTRIPSVLCTAETWAFAINCNATRISWAQLEDHVYGIYDHTIGAAGDSVFSFGGHLCPDTKGRQPFYYLNEVTQLKVYWTTLQQLDYCGDDGRDYHATHGRDGEL
jgi:hypothetical protein